MDDLAAPHTRGGLRDAIGANERCDVGTHSGPDHAAFNHSEGATRITGDDGDCLRQRPQGEEGALIDGMAGRRIGHACERVDDDFTPGNVWSVVA